MLRTTLLLILVSLGACKGSKSDDPTSNPDPAKPAAPSPAAPKATEPKLNDAYDTHMHAGDQLENQKKWSEALAEFEQALAAKPSDAKALGEIGWTAFFAGKLDRAREASEAAVTAAGQDAKLRGVALFNLGLSVEKSSPNAAAALYSASDKLRPNPSVKARLAKVIRDDYDKVIATTPDGDALLKKVAVDPLKPPSRRKDPTPVDRGMLAALDAAQVGWDWGAGHGAAVVDKLACTETTSAKPHTYACTNPAVSGDAAKQLVDNLVARKIKGKTSGDHIDFAVANIRCTSFDVEGEGGRIDADSCEVTR